MNSPRAAGGTPDEFALIADSAPVPMWVTRLDRVRSFVNRAYVDFVGVPYDAALAFDWRSILHADDIDRIVRESVAGEASLRQFTLEGRYRRGDGEWRWLRSVSQPRRDAGGAVIGFIGVAHDITEAKEAEQRLRNREQQLSALVDQTSAGLAQVDLAGRFTFVNDRYCAIVARPREELLATTMQAITHPDDLTHNLPLFDEAVHSGTPYNHEKRYVRPDGSAVWVSNAVTVIRNAAGVPYGVLAVTLDITARRAAEAAFRRSEESVRLAIQSAGMATWELDLNTMQGVWSPNRFELLGYPVSPTGTGSLADWLACVHPDDLERARAAVERCCADGTAFAIDYRILRADTGELRWLQSHGSRVEPSRDRASRFVGVSFDITETRRAADDIAENERRLRFLDQLSRATQNAEDADAVMRITTARLGEHLGVSDCAYADMEADEDLFHIRGDWHRADVQSIVGIYSLATFGSLAVTNLRAGQPLIVNDNIAELGDDGAAAFLAIGIRATICMPLVKHGKLTALMAIHDAVPHRWTDRELRLLREVTERSWAHIERVRSEAALRESEARLRLAIEGAQIGTWDWDLVTSRGTWSTRAAEIMGVAFDTDLTPEVRYALIHPEDRERVRAQVVEAIDQLSVFWSEYRICRPDGELRWVASRGVVTHGADGTPTRMTGTLRDVTNRRQAQEALETLNRTLEQKVAERTAERDRMWRLSGDLLLVIDTGWRIRAANPASEALLGYTPDQLIGRRLGAFIHPDDRRAVTGFARAGARTTISDFAARLVARDRSVRLFSWTAAPGEGEAYVIGRDITAERDRRAELEQAQESLRQTQKVESIGQLTGGVAHDFNNLLTPIMGNLDLLKRRVTGEREQRLIAAAAESADRARTLVQRLLAFARRQPLRTGPVDIDKLVTGMRALLASTAGPQIALVVTLDDDLPSAQADLNQLELALLNLSVNARDAMPDGGTLTVAASSATLAAGHESGLAPGRYVRLSIADTGVGMDEATLARAVEPFFSTKGVGKGTGLGLSMVHGLAMQLGGAMTIASSVGSGTEIALYLPVARTDQPVAAPRAAPVSAPAVATTVLLVDDEAAVRATTRAMLEDLGYTVVEAGGAREALTLVGSGASLGAEIVVTDHLMPGMTGAELAGTLHDRHPHLKILLVSGYAELETISTDIARLAKPFRQHELAARLAAL